MINYSMTVAVLGRKPTLLYTLEPLCSIFYKVNCSISSDIGWLDEQTGHKFTIMDAWCTIYNKFLIGWVAVQ